MSHFGFWTVSEYHWQYRAVWNFTGKKKRVIKTGSLCQLSLFWRYKRMSWHGDAHRLRDAIVLRVVEEYPKKILISLTGRTTHSASTATLTAVDLFLIDSNVVPGNVNNPSLYALTDCIKSFFCRYKACFRAYAHFSQCRFFSSAGTQCRPLVSSSIFPSGINKYDGILP